MTEGELIQGSIKNDRRAQKALYERYAPKMMGVCSRYVADKNTAEDILLEGFFKVFKNLEKFKAKGSFEGWIRRIMVNESLMHLRKKKAYIQDIEKVFDLSTSEPDMQDVLQESDLMTLIQELPTGYRTVFNMYVIEGFKHKEIAEQLEISINTSKSQLIQAKKKLKQKIQKKNHINSSMKNER